WCTRSTAKACDTGAARLPLDARKHVGSLCWLHGCTGYLAYPFQKRATLLALPMPFVRSALPSRWQVDAPHGFFTLDLEWISYVPSTGLESRGNRMVDQGLFQSSQYGQCAGYLDHPLGKGVHVASSSSCWPGWSIPGSRPS